MFKDFRSFLSRGNVIDLAVAVIIGAAFGKIVTSLVNDILMPPIGLLLGNVDFSNLFINLSNKHYSSLAAAQKAGAPTINYGLFISTIINFIIIAFAIFLVVKFFERFKKKEAEIVPNTKECPFCLSTVPKAALRCPQCTSALELERER